MQYNYPQVRTKNTAPKDYGPFSVRRYGRHWEVLDAAGHLVCLTVYHKGAVEVIRRLRHAPTAPESTVLAEAPGL